MIFGLILIVSGVRNTTGTLGTLIAGDFTGTKNFFYWLGAILIVGSVGYIPKAQTASRAFIVLIMVVMVISDKGFFAQFTSALSGVKAQAPSTEQNVGAAQPDTTATQGGQGSASAGSSAPSQAQSFLGLPVSPQAVFNFAYGALSK